MGERIRCAVGRFEVRLGHMGLFWRERYAVLANQVGLYLSFWGGGGVSEVR